MGVIENNNIRASRVPILVAQILGLFVTHLASLIAISGHASAVGLSGQITIENTGSCMLHRGRPTNRDLC